MEYLQVRELREKASKAEGKERLKEVHEEIGKEMSRAMNLLREEDNITVRRDITDERYELKCLAHDVMTQLTKIVRAEMIRRKGL